MALRFRRSIKILPGVRVNFNKKSTSVTFGGKRFKTTVNNSTGAVTSSARTPIKGVYYSEKVGGQKNSNAPMFSKKETSPKVNKTCGIIIIILAALLVVVFAIPFLTVTPFGLLFLLPAALLFRYGRRLINRAKEQTQKQAGE